MAKNKKGFRMPTRVTIKGRSSSITNSFVNGVIPCIQPSNEELEAVYKHFGMKENDVKCVYCGAKATEWDHFHPLIDGKGPTGYFSEINNLVPACGKCNQSKGNSDWRNWMEGKSSQAQTIRNIQGFDQRFKKLEEYEEKNPARMLDFNKVPKWGEYMTMREGIFKEMEKAQEVSKSMKDYLSEHFEECLIPNGGQ